MKKDLCELVFVLDKSGSMAGMENDTTGGFNANIESNKKLGGKVRVTTALFDAFSEASNLGISHDHAMNFDASAQGFKSAWASVGVSTALLRQGKKVKMKDLSSSAN